MCDIAGDDYRGFEYQKVSALLEISDTLKTISQSLQDSQTLKNTYKHQLYQRIYKAGEKRING